MPSVERKMCNENVNEIHNIRAINSIRRSNAKRRSSQKGWIRKKPKVALHCHRLKAYIHYYQMHMDNAKLPPHDPPAQGRHNFEHLTSPSIMK